MINVCGRRASRASRRQLEMAMLFALAVLLTAACGGSVIDGEPTLENTAATSTTASPTETEPPVEITEALAEPTPILTSTPTAKARPAVPVVTAGAACGPRGAVAVFADGSTAYCARLQYTDGAVWSYDSNLAPNPAVTESLKNSGPQIGDKCIGADIGRKGTDANGTAIMCDNYQWAPDLGQVPKHPWVDGQGEWSECMKVNTEEECRQGDN